MNEPLHSTLAEVARRHRRLTRGVRLAHRARLWLVALAAAMLVDAGWTLIGAAFEADPMVVSELPAGARAVMAGLLLVGLVWVADSLRLRRAVRQMTDADYARCCEKLAGLPGNPLINAVQLQGIDWPDDLAAALSRRAVQLGQATIERIDPATLFDDRPLCRQRRRLAITVAALVVLALGSAIVLSPSAPWRAVRRLAEPWADDPPLSWHHWQVRVEPRPVAIGDTVAITAAVNRPPQGPGEMVLFTADGTVDARLPLTAETGRPGTYRLTLRNAREPIRFRVVGSHARSALQVVEPVNLPRVLDVAVSMRLPAGGRPIAMRAAPGKPVVGPAGGTVMLTVTANRPDAIIQHPRAHGLRLSVPITEGEQTVTFHLVSGDGLVSRRGYALKVIGLTEAKLAAYLEQQRREKSKATVAVKASGGEATDAASANGESTDTPQTTAQSTGAPTGHDERTTGTGGDQPGDAGRADPLASGNVVQSALTDPALPPAIRQMAGRAPAAYRELVAEYFLRISRDADRKDGP